MVRFADDFVVVCAERVDAESLLGQIRERFAAYGLTIHPEKTRIVDFRHPWKSERKPQTFDFLGFTHYWGKTRKGGFAVKQRWHYWLMRRSRQRHNSARLWQTLLQHFALPRPRIFHGQRPDQLQWSFVS